MSLSPIHKLWQYGEFISLSLEMKRMDNIFMCTKSIIKMIEDYNDVNVIADVLLLDEDDPDSCNIRDILTKEIESEEICESDTGDFLHEDKYLQLLRVIFYVPLCPKPADSLSLFQNIIQLVAPELRKHDWFETIILPKSYQIMHVREPATWYDVVRSKDIYTKLEWLLGNTSPLSFPKYSLDNNNNNNNNKSRFQLFKRYFFLFPKDDIDGDIQSIVMTAFLKSNDEDVIYKLFQFLCSNPCLGIPKSILHMMANPKNE